ncbi:MAG: tryptophan 2,3-dioxygenase family protein [Chloroflexota bacterium]
MNEKSALNYVSYLQLDQILTAQTPKSVSKEGFEHDEMLFIIIHQVYELWFKQMLHETDHLIRKLNADDLPNALGTLRRILVILKTVVGQIDILETMTPLQFNSFRSFLESSSGFQSVQFREFEFALGYKRETMLTHFSAEIHGVDRLQQRFAAPSLWDVFLRFLQRQGYAIPAALLNRDVAQPIEPSSALQDVLVHIYRTDAWNGRLCERLVDLDEGLQEWRYRHVKMVARTIGSKMGTGGSAGVKYLESTVKPLWPDLWAIRAQL